MAEGTNGSLWCLSAYQSGCWLPRPSVSQAPVTHCKVHPSTLALPSSVLNFRLTDFPPQLPRLLITHCSHCSCLLLVSPCSLFSTWSQSPLPWGSPGHVQSAGHVSYRVSEEEKLPRGMKKSNGVFINRQWDCPKQLSRNSPDLLLVCVFKGKATVVTYAESKCCS